NRLRSHASPQISECVSFARSSTTLSGQTFTVGPTTANAPTSARSARIVFSRTSAPSPTLTPLAHTVSLSRAPGPIWHPSHNTSFLSPAPSPTVAPAPPTTFSSTAPRPTYAPRPSSTVPPNFTSRSTTAPCSP